MYVCTYTISIEKTEILKVFWDTVYIISTNIALSRFKSKEKRISTCYCGQTDTFYLDKR